MGIKHWNVVLVPEGNGAVRSLKIPTRLLWACLGIVVLGFLSVASSVGVHLWNLSGIRAVKSLRSENTALRNHLTGVNRSLEKIEGMVRDGEQMEKEARLLAGLDPIDSETRELGVGGPLLTSAAGSAPADPVISATLREQNNRLDQLSRQVNFQKESLEETLSRLRNLGDRLAHTPSICPLHNQYVVSAGFGWRNDPFTGQRAFHSGLDLSAEPGTPVFSTAAGEVEFVGPDGEFGLCVRIKHGYGYETAYCHLGATQVHQGQLVQRGDRIGQVGSSGRSTGPHLHYEVHVDGAAQDPSPHILTPRTIAD